MGSKGFGKVEMVLHKEMSRRYLLTLAAGGASVAALGLSQENAFAAKGKPAKYAIVYVLNGGTQAQGQRLSLKADTTCSVSKLLAPKRKGYSFTGWFSDKDLEKPLDVLQGVKKASKRTAYAGWKRKTYTITYVDNDAYDTVRTKTYTVTTASFAHEKPSRKGHAFAGWFLDDKFEEAAPKTIAKGSTGSKTLYAKWDMKAVWKDYLPGVIDEAKTRKAAVGSNGESFIFLTDPHLKSNALCSLPAIEEVMEKTKIKLFFMGGDIINADAKKEDALKRYQLWNKETSFATVYCMRGNHDNNSNGAARYVDTDNQITDDELCQLIFPHLLSADGLTCRETVPAESSSVPGLASADAYASGPMVMETVGEATTLRQLKAARTEKVTVEGVTIPYPKRQLCYVVDNESCKIRHIVLDTGAPDFSVIDVEQLAWMQRRILELEAGWTVVVFSHQFFCLSGFDKNGQQIMCALDAVYDSSKAAIAGVISGHSHRDYAFRTQKGYVAVCSASDAYKAMMDESITAQRATGIVQQAFDIVHVDTANRQLFFQRVGFGSDRMFSY